MIGQPRQVDEVFVVQQFLFGFLLYCIFMLGLLQEQRPGEKVQRAA